MGTFVLSKLFWAVASPDSLIVILLMLGIAARLARWRWIGRALFGAGALLVFAITFLPMGDWLLRPLETRFPRPVLPESVDGIIILGGGIDEHLTQAWGQPKVTEAASRLIMGVGLARKYPAARVLYTGGSASIQHPDESEADTAGVVLATMGVEGDRVILEKRSRNTLENAVFSKDLVQPKPGETWVLVTSAYHMPRSVGVFRRAGWSVVPFPVDYGIMPTREFDPSFLAGLNAVFWGSKEWIGLLFYYAADRTDALFPGP